MDTADSVRFSCPNCGKHYNAPRARIGSAGKCGKCAARFVIRDGAAEPAAAPAVPPPSPPLRSRTPTPVYASDADEAARGSVVAPSSVDDHANDASEPTGGASEPTCYLERGTDGEGVVPTILSAVEDSLREELGIERFIRVRKPPPTLGEADVYVFAGVEDASLGVRFLDGLALMSSRGEVLVSGRARKGSSQGLSFSVKASSFAPGLIGLAWKASGQQAKELATSVSAQFVRKVAVHVTGRRYLTQDVFGHAKWSIVLGVLGLASVGLTCLVGLPLGMVALRVLRKRGVERRQTLAKVGIVLNAVMLVLMPTLFWLNNRG